MIEFYTLIQRFYSCINHLTFILYLAISNTENDVNSVQLNPIYEISESNDLNELIDIFNVNDTPKHIISEYSEFKPLLGKKMCSFGPEYWCSSKEAMEECNVSLTE